MKQDKGHCVLVMDKSKYTKKCLNILPTEQFTKLGMIQQSLLKIRYNRNEGN